MRGVRAGPDAVEEGVPLLVRRGGNRAGERTQRAFETASLETDLLLAFFRVPMPGEECMFLTVGEILQHINGV